jgi:hypothetical protein
MTPDMQMVFCIGMVAGLCLAILVLQETQHERGALLTLRPPVAGWQPTLLTRPDREPSERANNTADAAD